MNLLEKLDSEPLFIHAVEFSEDAVAVHFQEKREMGDTGFVSRSMTLLMETPERETMFLELQAALRELVDDGYLALRQESE